MANLNLSQFTEKTFVADADHTFIWDTAGAISKRVSRNSWLNSGTLTSDAPVTISQTWNNAAVAFTGLKVNATSTASASGSLLLDLQSGGVSRFSITKDGVLQTSPSVGVFSLTDSANNIAIGVFGFYIGSAGLLSFSVGGANNSARGTSLLLDGAANTLALRNGANAQTFNVYNTYTNASNYERAVFGYGSNQINLGSDVAGSGAHRKLNILGAGIDFYTAGVGIRWSISTSGHFIAATDNQFDIGASGANRPRNVYVSSWIRMAVTTVGALPAAATAGAGARMFVSDALAPTFGSAVASGGSVTVPVYSTGSAWNVG